MKDNIKNSEEKLLNIPLFQRLKITKGPHFLKKFIKVSERIKAEEEIVIPNQKRTILIALIEGKISLTVEKRKK